MEVSQDGYHFKALHTVSPISISEFGCIFVFILALRLEQCVWALWQTRSGIFLPKNQFLLPAVVANLLGLGHLLIAMIAMGINNTTGDNYQFILAVTFVLIYLVLYQLVTTVTYWYMESPITPKGKKKALES